MNNKILIERINYPNDIRINGEKHSILCEYIDKDGKEIKLFEKDGTRDVVTVFDDEYAIAGLFSTTENKIKELVDFIEATVAKNQHFKVKREDFCNSLMVVANRKDYPFLHRAMDWNTKPSLFQNLFLSLREGSEKRVLSLELLKRMKAHTVYVEVVEKAVKEEPEIYQPKADYEECKPQPFLSPAKTLPEGWRWCAYPDEACGSLKSPDGKTYFSYDLAPYADQGGIEYKKDEKSAWDIHWGSLSGFKEYAESNIKRKLDLTLGEIYLPEIMSDVERNAWNGKEPRKVCITAGEHLIEIEGYTYEQSYEDFTADASISFNGEVLYEKDARCVGSYQYETYHKGSFPSYEEAICFIKEQTVGLEFAVIPEEKEPLENKIQEAGEKVANGQDKVSRKEPEMSL